MSLIGFRGIKSIRGNFSVLFKGRGQVSEGELFVVDHESKSVFNLLSDVDYSKIDKDIDEILNDT